MVEARIQEVGEEVEFIGRHTKAYPGGTPLEGEKGVVVKIEDRGEVGGYSHIGVWVETNLREEGKRLVVAASPLELAGMRIESV